VPELAALSLADGVVGQDDVAALDQVNMQDLIGSRRLALGRVATGTDQTGEAPGDLLRLIQKSRHEVTGRAFEDELFDDIIFRFDLAQDPGRWHPVARGQSAE